MIFGRVWPKLPNDAAPHCDATVKIKLQMRFRKKLMLLYWDN